MSETGLPDAGHRWRCAHCGNLTRFDVVRSRRTREFWHADLSGSSAIEEEVLLEETVESVTCRWCSSSAHVEVIARP